MTFIDFLKDPITFITQWFTGLLASWGLPPGAVHMISICVGAFLLAMGAMLLVVFLIWLERKLIGRVQDRLGPNRIGPWGLFQPVADMIKIFTKELITPAGADRIPFNVAPVLAVGAVLLVWAVIPLGITFYGVDLNVGLLFIIAVGSLGEMAIVMAGWGSNNKYALLGAFRAVGQMISYSVPMVVSLMIPVMISGSLSMTEIVQKQNVWFVFVAPLAALILFITSIAEVGRSPFDLVEAESELVAGFNVEYSGLKFGMFYVGEFLHAFTVALIFTTVFLGGWRGPGAAEIPVLGFFYLFIKTFLVYFLTVVIRSTLPRFRIDQMMDLNWKLLTPLSLVVVVVTAVAYKLTQHLPVMAWVLIMIAINGLLLLATTRYMNWFTGRRKRLEVGSRERPVARPPAEETHSEIGAGL